VDSQLSFETRRPCSLGNLAGSIDQEFVSSKGRSGSLVDRYPAVFSEDAEAFFVLMCAGGRDIGCACIWPRVLTAKLAPVAMVGFVYVVPHERGSGRGQRLMLEVSRACRDLAPTAVLWTSKHAFYETLGWSLADSGVVVGIPSRADRVASLGVDIVDWQRAISPDEYIRASGSLLRPTVIRSSKSVRSVPAFCLRSDLWIARSEGRIVGTAVVACDAKGAFTVLDVESEWQSLLSLRMLPVHRDAQFTLNCDSDSELTSSLVREGLFMRTSKLAMWLGERGREVRSYIPWVDRL
jgi:predicted N-acetyltransferase YhbS